jgi:hypothetical protein
MTDTKPKNYAVPSEKLQKILDHMEKSSKELLNDRMESTPEESVLRITSQQVHEYGLSKDLVTHPIDTSSWTEFSEDFFNLPIIPYMGLNATTSIAHYNPDDTDHPVHQKLVYCPVSSFCFYSHDKDKAVSALRQELLKLSKDNSAFEVLAFLSKPSTATIPYVDKTRHIAFCFAHVVKPVRYVEESDLKAAGYTGACLEGQLGTEV